MDTQFTIVIVLVLIAVAFLGYYFYGKFSNPENNSINPNADNLNEVTITSDFEEESNLEFNERTNPERYDER